MRPELDLGDDNRYIRFSRHVDGVIYIEVGGAGVGFMNFEIEPEDESKLREFLDKPRPKWPVAHEDK